MPDRVNYDAIASTYNRRFAEQPRSGTLQALAELVQAMGAERVLEVGCGTGHWLAGLSNLAPQVYGLDFSAGMLAQAQQQENPLALLQGQAVEAFSTGLGLYRQGCFDQAVTAFQQALEHWPDFTPSRLFLQRCQILQSNSPTADWDAVFRPDTK